MAAALRQDRLDRRERRRLHHGAPTARSRSPRPRVEEVLFPEDRPSPSEGPSAASPSPASTRSKYGGLPAPPSTSSGRSRSVPEEELRAVRRDSRDAAPDAAWLEEEQAPRCGERSFRPGGGAGPSGAPAAPPPPPPARKGSSQSVPGAIRRASRAAASDAAWLEDEQETHHGERSVRPGGGAGPSGAPAAPPPPLPTRTRKFPRGHPCHAGPRLLALPAERRGGGAPGSPPPGSSAGNSTGSIAPARTCPALMSASMAARSAGGVIRLLTA